MGGRPVAFVTWNGAFAAQVPPGSMTPVKVSFPVQPPASGPVAVKLIDVGEGVFVYPGLKVIDPVGAAGVPPHVQIVGVPRAASPDAYVACPVKSAIRELKVPPVIPCGELQSV